MHYRVTSKEIMCVFVVQRKRKGFSIKLFMYITMILVAVWFDLQGE